LGPPSTHLHLLKICSNGGKTKCTKENIPKRQIQGSSTLRLIEIYQFDQKDIRGEIAETNWWLKTIVNWDICEELKDSTAKSMSLLSRGKEPPHVTHRDSRTFGVITITITWLVRTRPGSRVHSLSAPYTYFFYPPTHHLLNTLIF